MDVFLSGFMLVKRRLIAALNEVSSFDYFIRPSMPNKCDFRICHA